MTPAIVPPGVTQSNQHSRQNHPPLSHPLPQSHLAPLPPPSLTVSGGSAPAFDKPTKTNHGPSKTNQWPGVQIQTNARSLADLSTNLRSGMVSMVNQNAYSTSTNKKTAYVTSANQKAVHMTPAKQKADQVTSTNQMAADVTSATRPSRGSANQRSTIKPKPEKAERLAQPNHFLPPSSRGPAPLLTPGSSLFTPAPSASSDRPPLITYVAPEHIETVTPSESQDSEDQFLRTSVETVVTGRGEGGSEKGHHILTASSLTGESSILDVWNILDGSSP